MTFRSLPSLFLAAVLIIAAYSAKAQIPEDAPSAEPPSTTRPFTLIVLGTRHYQDVDVIVGTLKGLPYIDRIVPTFTSQLRQEFEGSYQHKEGDLIADVRGLAADRFHVETRPEELSGVVITLRKMGAPTAVH